MTPSQLRALQQNISQHRPKWQSFSSNSSEGRKWEMDDKEIKNDLPGPVSHFSAQARCSPSSSLSYSHTLIYSLSPISSHPLPPLLPISLLLQRHVTTPHDYWRNHSCNSLPSFPWGLQYLSLSLPKCSAIVLEIVCVRQEMPVTHFDKGASDVRALITQKNSSLMCPIMCPSKSHK